jgi:hypothetical protein
MSPGGQRTLLWVGAAALLGIAFALAWGLTAGVRSVLSLFGPPAQAPAAKQAAGAPGAAESRRRLTPPWPPGRRADVKLSGDLFARNYYVVLDASGSMNEKGCSGGKTKIDAARQALAEFAKSIPAEANLGLQVFDARGVREWLPLGVGNRAEFDAALARVRANGETPLLSAVRNAGASLRAQGARQLGYGEYNLVIVTDGEASKGEDPTPAVNALLDQSPVVLHTIGFCIGEKHSLNQPGRTLYRAADNPEQLRAGLAEVLAEAPTFAVLEFGK